MIETIENLNVCDLGKLLIDKRVILNTLWFFNTFHHVRHRVGLFFFLPSAAKKFQHEIHLLIPVVF